MAAKRFFDDNDNDPDQQPIYNHKRIKSSSTPSLASVVKEVVMVKFLENFCSTLEPLLRRVVNEEVENGLKSNMRALTKSPSLRIQSLDQQEKPILRLMFKEKLSLPIFTGSKITDIQNNPLQILLVNNANGIVTNLPDSLKIQIVVLDGDFPNDDNSDDQITWTNQDFDKNILKERTGKRPLLAGDHLNITMKDGGIISVGELEFTDNSSWIRSRKFRIGARIVKGTITTTTTNNKVLIRPAMTESFVVKDHRGELYKKHYPPALEDEVWRLEKIGKDGAFHKKLSAEGIKTVQDFLKLSVIEPNKLRKILGIGMSEKMWAVTHRHAWSCMMGNKHYIARGQNYIIILNPVCQVVKAVINGQAYGTRDLTLINRAYIEKLIKDAYANWNNLEEIDAQVNDTALLAMGNNNMGSTPNIDQLEYTDWAPYLCTPAQNGGPYFSDHSSSDGDLH